MPPAEGDPVFINGVTVAPNGIVWWSSPQYGIASFEEKVGFKYFDPSAMGVAGSVTDIVALPDGSHAAIALRDTGAATAAGADLPAVRASHLLSLGGLRLLAQFIADLRQQGRFPGSS